MSTSDPKPKESPEQFLSRWSQRKQQARVEEQSPPPAPVAQPDKPPELPSLESLTTDSDYRGFLHPKVDESLRRAALKKLFSDPHFNVMDGLDTYIDDYSISDPLPAAMLAELKQAQNIFAWAKETEEEAVVRRGGPAVDAAAVVASESAAEAVPAVTDAAEADTVEAENQPADAQTPDGGTQNA